MSSLAPCTPLSPRAPRFLFLWAPSCIMSGKASESHRRGGLVLRLHILHVRVMKRRQKATCLMKVPRCLD